VYSPLFSGVAYDMQDVLMDDVERIEVISGPGATLWGANAMNGVINIITRRAEDSQGTLVRVDAGAEEKDAALRYGGTLGSGAYRVYAKWFDRGETELSDGAGAGDDWNLFQTGFRADLERGQSGFTLQGDYQRATQNFLGGDPADFSGANLLGSWTHTGALVKTRVQVYFDHVDREKPPSGIAFDINTMDFDILQSADLAGRHQLVWGLGRRLYDYDTENNVLAFVPHHRDLHVTNLFVQDGITLNEHLKLTAGVKFEENSYSGWEVLPDLRLSWSPNDSSLWWLAGSRAVRAPTPFDTEVQEFVGGQLFLIGDPDFRPEEVTAFELGMRANPGSRVSYSASVFYDEYDDLRTVEITPVTLLPLRWGNLMKGSAYGVEAWANFQVARWWRLSPGFRSVHKRLEFREGSSELLGVAQAGNDPHSNWQLKSSMDLGKFTVDAMVRHIGAMPQPAVDAYTELSARLGWRINERIELAIKGFNLLDETHREFADPQGREIRRSVLAEIRFTR
jgi:iron complex outermembrane receptor protein